MSEQNQSSPAQRPLPRHRRPDPVGTAAFALFLIWVGVLWLLSNIDLVDPLVRLIEPLNLPGPQYSLKIPFLSPDVWQIFLLGAGWLQAVPCLA